MKYFSKRSTLEAYFFGICESKNCDDIEQLFIEHPEIGKKVNTVLGLNYACGYISYVIEKGNSKMVNLMIKYLQPFYIAESDIIYAVEICKDSDGIETVFILLDAISKRKDYDNIRCKAIKKAVDLNNKDLLEKFITTSSASAKLAIISITSSGNEELCLWFLANHKDDVTQEIYDFALSNVISRKQKNMAVIFVNNAIFSTTQREEQVYLASDDLKSDVNSQLYMELLCGNDDKFCQIVKKHGESILPEAYRLCITYSSISVITRLLKEKQFGAKVICKTALELRKFDVLHFLVDEASDKVSNRVRKDILISIFDTAVKSKDHDLLEWITNRIRGIVNSEWDIDPHIYYIISKWIEGKEGEDVYILSKDEIDMLIRCLTPECDVSTLISDAIYQKKTEIALFLMDHPHVRRLDNPSDYGLLISAMSMSNVTIFDRLMKLPIIKKGIEETTYYVLAKDIINKPIDMFKRILQYDFVATKLTPKQWFDRVLRLNNEEYQKDKEEFTQFILFDVLTRFQPSKLEVGHTCNLCRFNLKSKCQIFAKVFAWKEMISEYIRFSFEAQKYYDPYNETNRSIYVDDSTIKNNETIFNFLKSAAKCFYSKELILDSSSTCYRYGR
jgi:hypothetical protein